MDKNFSFQDEIKCCYSCICLAVATEINEIVKTSLHLTNIWSCLSKCWVGLVNKLLNSLSRSRHVDYLSMCIIRPELTFQSTIMYKSHILIYRRGSPIFFLEFCLFPLNLLYIRVLKRQATPLQWRKPEYQEKKPHLIPSHCQLSHIPRLDLNPISGARQQRRQWQGL